MNYINEDKNYMSDAEWIRYLEESIRELRKEKENLKKEKGELKARLEEENRLLKNEIAWLKDHTKYNSVTEEEYIDGTMTATEAKLRLEQARQNQIYVSNLEEENKKLKEKIRFLEQCLDNKEKVNKSLREEKKSEFYEAEIKNLTEDRDWCYRNLQEMWKWILENVDEETINKHFEVILPEGRLLLKKDLHDA